MSGAGPELYRARFTFQGKERGDLTIQKGEIVNVLGKQGPWWMGCLGDGRTGNFPASCVELVKVEFFFFSFFLFFFFLFFFFFSFFFSFSFPFSFFFSLFLFLKKAPFFQKQSPPSTPPGSRPPPLLLPIQRSTRSPSPPNPPTPPPPLPPRPTSPRQCLLWRHGNGATTAYGNGRSSPP